jgi:peptide deformylase
MTKDDDLVHLCQTLIDTLRGHRTGVGLSAIQIGIPKRAFVIFPIYSRQFYFFANPVITKQRRSQALMERCLSLPGISRKVERPEMITVKGLNEHRAPVKMKFEGIEAAIVCHECDHLDGILIIDKQQEEV